MDVSPCTSRLLSILLRLHSPMPYHYETSNPISSSGALSRHALSLHSKLIALYPHLVKYWYARVRTFSSSSTNPFTISAASAGVKASWALSALFNPRLLAAPALTIHSKLRSLLHMVVKNLGLAQPSITWTVGKPPLLPPGIAIIENEWPSAGFDVPLRDKLLHSQVHWEVSLRVIPHPSFDSQAQIRQHALVATAYTPLPYSIRHDKQQ